MKACFWQRHLTGFNLFARRRSQLLDDSTIAGKQRDRAGRVKRLMARASGRVESTARTEPIAPGYTTADDDGEPPISNQ